MSITSSVLRRYMRELFGTRAEPWRMAPRDIKEQTMQYTGELFTDAGTGFTLFPLNATATDVPLLPKTSAIDLDALFPRTHSIAIGSDEIHDAPTAVPDVISQSINTPRPARKPTEPPPLPPRVSGRMAAQPSGSMPVVHLPPVQMPRPTEGHTAIVTPYTQRRSWLTVVATAAIVLGFGIGTYLLLSSDGSSVPAAAGTPTVHAPYAPAKATVTPIPRPTATPIEVAKPAEPKPPEIDPDITIEPTVPTAPPAQVRVAPSDTPAPPPAAKKKACTDPLDCQF